MKKIVFLSLFVLVPPACAAAEPDEAALQKAATFYASFDESPQGDHGAGDRSLSTRFNHATEKGQFVFEKGFDKKIFRVAPGKGVHGGALECTDVLPRNGRIFFPARGKLAWKKGGWGGAVSLWINTDPNTSLKTPFCDPVQITQRGANDGGIWCDFNDRKPRDLRMGTFPAVPSGEKPIPESDPAAPLVPLKGVGFKAGEWHHIVLTWRHFDTGKPDAHATLYIDGKPKGDVKDRAIAMNWDMERTGIYLAINFIGLLDEFALFNRPLTAEEVALLHRRPGLLAPLAKP